MAQVRLDPLRLRAGAEVAGGHDRGVPLALDDRSSAPRWADPACCAGAPSTSIGRSRRRTKPGRSGRQLLQVTEAP